MHIAAVGTFLGILSILGGIGIFLWQVYTWLRFSTWVPIDVLTALDWLNVAWARSPNDWIGLHRLLGYIPLAIAVPVIGFPISVMIAVTGEQWEEQDRSTQGGTK